MENVLPSCRTGSEWAEINLQECPGDRHSHHRCPHVWASRKQKQHEGAQEQPSRQTNILQTQKNALQHSHPAEGSNRGADGVHNGMEMDYTMKPTSEKKEEGQSDSGSGGACTSSGASHTGEGCKSSWSQLLNWDGLLLESFTTRLVLGLVLTRTPEQPEEDRKAG